MNCLFDGNQSGAGGGIFCEYSSPTVEACTFTGNTAKANGGGILCKGSSPIIEDCTFYGNSSGGDGAGVHGRNNSSPGIVKTIISFSTSGDAVHCEPGSSVSLSCSNLYGNAGGDWVDCAAGQSGTNGNFSQDPLFCDAPGGDLSLHGNSPCAPGNHPDSYACGLIGAHGVDCGSTTAVEVTDWGGIKSLFR